MTGINIENKGFVTNEFEQIKEKMKHMSDLMTNLAVRMDKQERGKGTKSGSKGPHGNPHPCYNLNQFLVRLTKIDFPHFNGDDLEVVCPM